MYMYLCVCVCVYTLGTAANSNSKIHTRSFCDCLIVVAAERADDSGSLYTLGVHFLLYCALLYYLISLLCSGVDCQEDCFSVRQHVIHLRRR